MNHQVPQNKQTIKLRLYLFTTTVFLVSAVYCNSFAGQKQTRRGVTRARPAAIDYSKFSHSTKKHQSTCDTCHKIPTSGWQKTSTFPDITDYPGHDACVTCHRAQFFKGVRPAICSVCHTKTSPRDEARLLFRNPGSPTQFSIEFPHDRHQDVIALLNKPFNGQLRVLAHAPFRRLIADDKTQTYNNCSICHGERGAPAPPAAGWPDGFQPKLETFKAVPSGHDSCFNCHWKSQQPIAQNCVGCHKLITDVFAASSPLRISLKFIHDGGGEKKVHIDECTTCHINITKAATLRGLKPDVPITSCSECHNKVGKREDLNKELGTIDKNKAFVCVYCHTSNVGALDPPASHYLIAERPPIKRKEIK